MNIGYIGTDERVMQDLRALSPTLGFSLCFSSSSLHDTDLFSIIPVPDCVLVDITAIDLLQADSLSDVQNKMRFPCLVIGESEDMHAQAAARNAQVFGFLGKPLDEELFRSALTTAIRHYRTEIALRDKVEELSQKLESRKVINLAKRFLMDRGFTEQEAYALLQKTSMNTRRPLRAIAEAVVLQKDLSDLTNKNQ